MDSMFPNAYVFNGNTRMERIWSDRIFTKWQYVTHDSMERIFSGDILAWDACNVKNMNPLVLSSLVMGGGRLRPGFAVIGAAIPVSDFAGMVTAILSDVNPEEISALSWGGQDVWSYILWRR